jgi:hypothetical protein
MIRKDRIQADILDRALQQILKGDAAVADSTRGEVGSVSEVRPLLETAGRVRKLLPARGPSPEYIAGSEARLLRRIKMSIPKTVRRESFVAGQARGGWLRTAALVAVTTMVVVCASGLGVTSASAQALPGDALYPVKQGLEELSLTGSRSADGDVALLADFTDERLEEIEQLVAKNRAADLVTGLENYDKTLGRLDAALEQLPSDSIQLDDIQARLARHTEVLLALRDRLPEQARPALDRAVEHSQISMDRVGKLQKNQSPDEIPPGQEKKSTQDAGKGNDVSSPTEKKPDTDPNVGTPELTETPELTNTSEPSKIPKESKTPKELKTPKPSKTPEPVAPVAPAEPANPPKPPKDKTKK